MVTTAATRGLRPEARCLDVGQRTRDNTTPHFSDRERDTPSCSAGASGAVRFSGDTEVRRRRWLEVSYPGAKRSEARFSNVVTALDLPRAEAHDSEPCGGAIVSRGQRPDRCRKGKKGQPPASGEKNAGKPPAGTFWPKRLISPRSFLSEESRFDVFIVALLVRHNPTTRALPGKQESLPEIGFAESAKWEGMFPKTDTHPFSLSKSR